METTLFLQQNTRKISEFTLQENIHLFCPPEKVAVKICDDLKSERKCFTAVIYFLLFVLEMFCWFNFPQISCLTLQLLLESVRIIISSISSTCEQIP